MRLVSEGKKDQEIAFIIGVKRETIRNVLQNAYKKLGVNNRISAVMVAIERNEITPPISAYWEINRYDIMME